MRAQPVDLIGGFYKDDSLPWSCQDTVNWLPVKAEMPGTRTQWKMETAPGLRESLWLGDGSSPIRGMHDLEGQLYFVAGQTLYRRRTDGGVDALGLIPGVGRVSMTHNQFKTGYQLLVENGQGGGGYVWDTTANTFARITDEGYPGSISTDYLDSYLLGVEPFGRYWFHSNLADATDYNTLDRYESETLPDKIVGLAVSNNDVCVFNERSVDFFMNTGAATGTFQNRKQSITGRGCASRYTIQKLDNTLFWLGDDGIVYRLNGYSAEPVSTRVMDRAIKGYNWSQAFAFTWEDNGFKCYVLTFPDGMTFSYDVISGLWVRRQSFALERWRLGHLVKTGGQWIGGDFQAGRLWRVDWSYFLEGSDPLIRRHVTGVVQDNQSALIIPSVELIFGTGSEPTAVQAPLAPATQYPSAPRLTGTLPTACAGATYTATLTATGGASPSTILKSAGPSGLQISNAGVITWPSPAVGTVTIGAQIRDAVGRTSYWQSALTIKPLTWNFTTWQTGGAYSSNVGGGQVIWASRSSVYVSCTGAARKRSADGITWTNIAGADFIGVAENPATARLVLIDSSSRAYTSDDGALNTTLRVTKPGIQGATLRFVDGRFVATLSTQMTIGGADGITWTDGPSFMSVVGVGPAWNYIKHLGIYLLISASDGRTATSATALGPYTAAGTIPGWSGNTGVLICYSERLKRTFITAGGSIRERMDDGTYVTRLASIGQAVTDIVDIPEMGALVAVCSGGQPSTAVSLDGGTTWTRYNGLNGFRLLAWSPPLGRLVAIGQNIANYANATCVL